MNSKSYLVIFSLVAVTLLALTGCETERNACEREKRITQRLDDMQMDLDGRIGAVNAEVANMRINPPVIVQPAPVAIATAPETITIEDTDYSTFDRKGRLIEENARIYKETLYAPQASARTTSKANLATKHIRVPVPVKTIQAALKEAGTYNGNIDGKIGNQTISAINNFQRAQGIKADGIVGRVTWQHLQAFVPAGMSSIRLK